MKRPDPIIDKSEAQKQSHLAAIIAEIDGLVAKIAYLTSPSPNRYLLNIQPFGSEELFRIEIGEGHLANIIVDGASFALRKHHRVPHTLADESATDGISTGT